MRTGIYKITNILSKKVYIGSSKNITKRWWQHKKQLNLGIHHNAHLQASWDLHGSSKFVWEILEECDEVSLIEIEQKYIDIHWGSNCYNILKIAGKMDGELNKIPVLQLDFDGNVIREWCSAADAMESLDIVNITACCRGRSGSAGGFRWRYSEPDLAASFGEYSTQHGGHGKKRVCLIDSTDRTTVLKVYESIDEAGKGNDVPHSAVSLVCSGERQHVKGMVFKFESDLITTSEEENVSPPTYECLICKASYPSLKPLATHIQFFHKISSEEYSIKYLYSGIRPGCLECGLPTRYVSFSFKKFCKKHSSIGESLGGKIGGSKRKNKIAFIPLEQKESIFLDFVDLEKLNADEFPSSIHLDNKNKALREGKKYLLIFSDEVSGKEELILSMVSNRLQKSQVKLNARDLEVDLCVAKSEAKEFFELNHIAGYTPSIVFFGLRDPKTRELISCLGLRKPIQHKESIEISRFATKLNCSLRGGFSRLLSRVNAWGRENNFNSIISYADLRFGDGKVYRVNGFDLVNSNTGINYWYTDGTKRIFRFKFRARNGKSEKEVAREAGVIRVYGCGNALYKLEIT